MVVLWGVGVSHERGIPVWLRASGLLNRIPETRNPVPYSLFPRPEIETRNRLRVEGFTRKDEGDVFVRLNVRREGERERDVICHALFGRVGLFCCPSWATLTRNPKCRPEIQIPKHEAQNVGNEG